MLSPGTIDVSDIGFEFDILIKGEHREVFDLFMVANPDWTCRCGKNGGFLAEPPQLADDGSGASAFVARHVDAYAGQLSALRAFGHGHCIRIAAYLDLQRIAVLSLSVKPSTMALASSLGYEIDFCVYPSSDHEDD
jgi:hypothetical protein